MLQPGVSLFLLVQVFIAAVGAGDEAAVHETDGNQLFGDRTDDRTPMDLDAAFINRHSQERSVYASKMALRQILNKAQHAIRVKDNDVYLLVRGFRDDAVHDFQSFQPTERWTDFGDGALFGQSGDRIVRLSSTKDRDLPVLDIMHDGPTHYSKTSVIYVDSLDEMENVYNFIKKNNYLVKP